MSGERIAAAKLRFLAKARREYFHAKEPEDVADLHAMSVNDLTLWVEAKTAEQLAGYLEDPASAWGWLPSWRLTEWQTLQGYEDEEGTE